jgi:hypothetical protein
MCWAVRVHGEPAGRRPARPAKARASQVLDSVAMHFDMHLLTDRGERDVPRTVGTAHQSGKATGSKIYGNGRVRRRTDLKFAQSSSLASAAQCHGAAQFNSSAGIHKW